MKEKRYVLGEGWVGMGGGEKFGVFVGGFGGIPILFIYLESVRKARLCGVACVGDLWSWLAVAGLYLPVDSGI